MNQFILLLIAIVSLAIGAVLGYYARQTIARKQVKSLEARIQKRVNQAKQETEKLLAEAKKKATQVLEKAKTKEDQRGRELIKTEHLLLKRQNILDEKLSELESREKEFRQKVQTLKEVKTNLESLRKEALEDLERVSKLSRLEAKKELLENLETEYQKEILEKLKKLETEGQEKMEEKAKEILTFAIQKCAISQAQDITTTTVSLPSDEVKGRIIGKEGRNIRTLEKLTGVEIIVDETPETVIISGFDPVRRQVAKMALEKLVRDGRIQPARIEKMVQEAKEELNFQVLEAGKQAAYETGIVGLDPKILQLLGRLKFRTSFGQNVLLHSMEVAFLAEALASELGVHSQVAKKAGLLHDIGKAVDHQVEGSHTEIGIKILEKFGLEKEVISAMKSHHEEYKPESLEAVIVQVADQISGARPGARKDTVENYLRRLQELESIAASFPGVEKAWALQAGREIRVFVNPKEVDDLTAQKLAKDIANRIQEELKYPGEIKVTLIREKRIVEYAK